MRGEQWIGSFGSLIAQILSFAVGRYMAFVLPTLLALDGWSAMFATPSPGRRMRTWTRSLGAVLMILSGCALLGLHLSLRAKDPSAAVFESGGIVGSFLVDARGLNLVRHLGKTGSFITFYGLSIAGLVLFTQTVLHDLRRLSFRALRWLSPLTWLAKVKEIVARILSVPRRWIANCVAVITSIPGLFRLSAIRNGIKATFGAIVSFPAKIQFERRYRSGRVMALAPIVELRGSSFESPAYDDVQFDDAEEPPPARRKAKRKPKKKSKRRGEGSGRFLPAGLDRTAGSRREAQQEMELFPQYYELPPLDILGDPPENIYRMSGAEQVRLSRKIEETLAQFRISVEVIDVVQGPVVTRFALHVAPGIKVSRIISLENDIAMALQAQMVRILAPIPGQAAVGIEVPNKRTNPVMLKELMECEELMRSKAPLAFSLGKNISGECVIADLAQMPHILIAGATGAGKSVCLNSIIASLLFRNPPSRVRMIMIDPKRVELSIYQAIPHLMAPVVCEPKKAAAALAWAVEQMEERYKLLARHNVRNIDGYNALSTNKPLKKGSFEEVIEPMSRIVVVIDELADLMMVAKNEVEEYIIRLAQMARAVGIHLILATQRPSVNVITGIIKANFPTRIAFRVSSKVDSRTILDVNGAETLLGRGDMLYSPGGVKPFRLQGTFVSDAEVESLADWIRAQEKANYEKEDFEALPTPAERAKARLMNSALGERAGGNLDEEDFDHESDYELDDGAPPMRMATRGRAAEAPLLPADTETLTDQDLFDIALRLILESRKASVSYIQRRLKIGYARAGRIMDMMEDQGIVGPYRGSRPREIIVDPNEFMAENIEE